MSEQSKKPNANRSKIDEEATEFTHFVVDYLTLYDAENNTQVLKTMFGEAGGEVEVRAETPREDDGLSGEGEEEEEPEAKRKKAKPAVEGTSTPQPSTSETPKQATKVSNGTAAAKPSTPQVSRMCGLDPSAHLNGSEPPMKTGICDDVLTTTASTSRPSNSSGYSEELERRIKVFKDSVQQGKARQRLTPDQVKLVQKVEEQTNTDEMRPHARSRDMDQLAEYAGLSKITLMKHIRQHKENSSQDEASPSPPVSDYSCPPASSKTVDPPAVQKPSASKPYTSSTPSAALLVQQQLENQIAKKDGINLQVLQAEHKVKQVDREKTESFKMAFPPLNHNPLSLEIWSDDLQRRYGYFRRVTLAKLGGKKTPMWQCSFCNLIVKSVDLNLQLHAATHFEHTVCECFVPNCKKGTLCTPSSLRGHLKTQHHLPVAKMSSEQNANYNRVVDNFYKEAEAVVYECFPPEAFIGFDEKERAKKQVDSKCKKCPEVINEQAARRIHVADHLNLKYNCVFIGCNHEDTPAGFATHFRSKHEKKVRQLNAVQRQKYENVIKKGYDATLKKHLPEYFPPIGPQKPSTKKSKSLHPQILWAQRKKELLLTVAVEDMQVEDLAFKDKAFYIKGTNSDGSQRYEASLELFEELDADSLRKFPITRQLEMVIDKKNPCWWPRLTSAKRKCAWVKVNEDKWKTPDAEDVDDVANMDPRDFDIIHLRDSGMEGMGGLGDTSGAGGDLSDLGGDEVDYASNKSQDEDDEDVNDVSSVIEDGEDDFSNLEGDELDYGTDEGDHVPVEEDDQGRGKPGIVWEDYAPVDYGTDEGDDMPPLEAAEETSEAKP